MKTKFDLFRTVSVLAIGVGLAATPAFAQQTGNAPILPNTEPETGPVSNSAGFALSLDGVTVDSDPQIEDQVRRADIALAQADVQIQMDTLDPTPRLDVEIAGAPRGYAAGDTLTLISETNYPAYLNRAEMRIIDLAATGGPRVVGIVAVAPNGQVTMTLPQGDNLVVVHRVYDARGRYDETQALSLMQPDARGQVDDVEEGSQFSANRNIPVNGGTVTVSATDIAQGAVLQTMGETVRPDPSGRVVIERILPGGDHVIDVEVVGGGQNLGVTRPVEVPVGNWFYVAVADLTYGRYRDNTNGGTYSETTGRLQYYVDGETESGVQITSSLDTGTQPLEDLFSRLDEKAPDDILDRIDAGIGYPTYGDDSTIVDNTPTSGRFYVRIERDNNFAMWGDYQATLSGGGYLRNERTLYGAQAHYEADQTTDRGDARTVVDLYAAQAEQLVGRDVFQGTGGSVYFLSQQDLSIGTQTVTVELRDAVTGRIVDRITLIEGRDYQINPLQGVITLSEPLDSGVDRRLVSTNPGSDETINLVVQYEYTPTTGNVDGFSYGGRIEHWVTDDLRIGVTGLLDDDGVTEQRSGAVDLRYEMGENSFVQLDYAQSDGRGFDRTISSDGGLVFATDAAMDGSGDAVKLEAQFALSDLGMARNGVIGAYFEDRSAGFTTLDYSDLSDETLYGVYAEVDAEDGQLGFALYADVYDNDLGEDRLEIGAEVSAELTPRLGLDAAIEHLDDSTGDRTDLALQLTYAALDTVDVYLFGQGTVANNGLDDNNRVGVGISAEVGNGWDIGAEVSDGTGGFGARILATQTRSDNSSSYFGYELDAGRALEEGIAASDNGGRYVAGSRRQINEDVAVFGENTYDIFGNAEELIGAYGVTYTPSDYLSYTVTYNMGQLDDDLTGDIDRQALSFGLNYEDEALRASGRIEARFDDFEDAAVTDTEAYFLILDANYEVSDASRMIFTLDYADTQASGTSFQEGRYVDVVLGYAHRPVTNERLNVLASYRYFYDDLGQEVDGIASSGPVQSSHIVSLEGNYDLNQNWTIAGKVGGRWAETAPAAGDVLVSNDAWLAVANARYHLVHNWDDLIEARHLELVDSATSQTGFLGAAYYQVHENAQIGVGYNFGSFSSDLTDLTFDDEGIFLNLVAQY